MSLEAREKDTKVTMFSFFFFKENVHTIKSTEVVSLNLCVGVDGDVTNRTLFWKKNEKFG